MNLILLYNEDFSNHANEVRLDGRRLKHVLYVHRAKKDDELTVGLLNGKIGRGKVISLSKSELIMHVNLCEDPPPGLPLTMLLALPRPKMLKRILFAATSLGVKRMYLFNSYRVEKSYWQTPVLQPNKFVKYLTPGLEQVRDTIVPQVELRRAFKPFVEDELPELIKGTTALVAHPYTETACPHNLEATVTLAVGPEGGFIPYEIDKFVELGFQPVHIGARILRVETAVTAIISRIFQAIG